MNEENLSSTDETVTPSEKKKQKSPKKNRNKFRQKIFRDWCKSCGICVEFCPKSVFERDIMGKPVIANPDNCIGCRFCEHHCPDFAITITERLDESGGGK